MYLSFLLIVSQTHHKFVLLVEPVATSILLSLYYSVTMFIWGYCLLVNKEYNCSWWEKLRIFILNKKRTQWRQENIRIIANCGMCIAICIYGPNSFFGQAQAIGYNFSLLS